MPKTSPTVPPPQPLSCLPAEATWPRFVLDGWGLWLAGPWVWKTGVLLLLLIHLSFLPWPLIPDDGTGPTSLHRLWQTRESEIAQRQGWGVRSPWAPMSNDTRVFEIVPGADFFAIYEAGWRAARGGDPFSVNVDRTPHGAPYMASFRYIPLAAYGLAVPISILPPWQAWVLWVVLNELILLVNLGLTSAFAPASRRRALGALWLVFFPLHIEWHLGQFSFLMGSMLFWSGLALWRQRPGVALFWWGLSTWLKNWTAILWPWWIGRGRRNALIATAWLAVAAATTAGYFLARPESWASFHAAATQGRLGWGGREDLYWGRQGVQMFVAALCEAGRLPEMRPPQWTAPAFDPARWINAALTALSLAIVIAAAFPRPFPWRRKACLPAGVQSRPNADSATPPAPHSTHHPHPIDVLALAWLWWFFAYLDAWEHHYVMLLPCVALLGTTGRLRGWVLWVPALLWALPSLFPWAVASVAARQPTAPIWVILYFAQRPLGVLIVGVALTLRLRAPNPLQPEDPPTPHPRTSSP